MDERDEIERLEQDLSDALRPVGPPAGFAERVEQRIRERQRVAGSARPSSVGSEDRPEQRLTPWPVRWPLHRDRWRDAVAAVLLLALLLGTAGWERRRVEHQRAEAAAARAQFEVAMAVTARSLHRAEQGVERLAAKKEAQ